MSLETHLKANAKEEKRLKKLEEKCKTLLIEVQKVSEEIELESSRIRRDTFDKISEVMKQ